MTTTTLSNTDKALCQQEEREAPRDVPLLLSLVERAARERQVPGVVPEIASHIARQVEQRLPVSGVSPMYWTEQTSEESICADQLQVRVTTYLQQGFRRLLLAPWGGRQSMSSLIEPVLLALSGVTGEAVSRTEIALPLVHVDGVSVRSGFEGLSSIQAQLGPLVEAFPGWGRTWTRLSAGEVKIVLLRSGVWTEQPSRVATWEAPTMKALTAALCLQQAGFMTASERSRWQRDGEIYMHYLVSLLCAAAELLQR